jgi:hypothetical protein
MTVLIRREPLRRILRWTRRALFCLGVPLVAYTGFALLDTREFQKRENLLLDRLLDEGRPQTGLQTPPPMPGIRAAVSTGDLIGRIEVPRLSLSVFPAVEEYPAE